MGVQRTVPGRPPHRRTLPPSPTLGDWGLGLRVHPGPVSGDPLERVRVRFRRHDLPGRCGGVGPAPRQRHRELPAPPGHYAFEFLLSDHGTKVVVVSGAVSTMVTLPANPSVGVTTPLYAWGNAQLAAISRPGGTGTMGKPYVLQNGGSATLNPLFGEFNDFQFPVFSGILLVNTSAYVTVTNAPSFFVTYSLPIEAAAIAANGLPSFNYLQQEYDNVHHVSVVGNPAISGWFSFELSGTMVGNVLFWNSSANLIAGNTFDDMSVGLFVYGGTNNVVWGNTISVSTPVAANPSSILNVPGNQTGIVLSANNDLLYNNYFDVPVPAVTPTTNVLTFLPSSYHDVWNVSSSPLHQVRVVNGFSLFGNIVGGARQGGNFWSTYGTPADPVRGPAVRRGGRDQHGRRPAAPHAVRPPLADLPREGAPDGAAVVGDDRRSDALQRRADDPGSTSRRGRTPTS